MRVEKINLENVGPFEKESIAFSAKKDPEKAELHLLTGENRTGKKLILYAMADKIFAGKEKYKEKGESEIILDITAYRSPVHRYPYHPMNWEAEELKQQLPFVFFPGYHVFPDVDHEIFKSIGGSTLQLLSENSKDGLKHLEQAVNTLTTENMEVINEAITFNELSNDVQYTLYWIGNLLGIGRQINGESVSAHRVNLLNKSFVLFLDEIEAGLDPKLQHKILPVLQKLFKNAQIFVSTNSPFVVASAEGAWIYHLKLQGRQSKVENVVFCESGKSYERLLREIFDQQEALPAPANGKIPIAEFNQQLAQLPQIYQLENKDEIEQFLARHQELAKVLIDAETPIKKHFADATLALRLVTDIEYPDWQRFFVKILHPYSYKEARDKESSLIREWFIPLSNSNKELLTIIEEEQEV